MTRILLSFVGNRDPYSDAEGTHGPLLSLLTHERFDQVVLFCTGSAYLERARTIETVLERSPRPPTFSFVNLELESVVDYEEIFARLRDTVFRITQSRAAADTRYEVLLDPGTPQMQTSWFLLVRSGQFDATLLQGVPARFAGGTYRVKEITFEGSVLPRLELDQKLQKSQADDDDAPEAGARAKGGNARAGGKPGAVGERGTAVGERGTAVSERRTAAWINAGSRPIVGSSPLFSVLLEQARQVARYDVSILVRGETGTGKNLLARYIHEASPRADGPFLELNCSAVTASLAESELFGHVSGAYTGATQDRLGTFRAADGGSIFLDEIGDLPLELQPKLLRVLEEKVVLPVGSDTPVPVDVRVIAATNRSLETMIEAGTFRRDLYERLKQVPLELPPLRLRREDIAPLVSTFVERWNHRYHEQKRFEPADLRAFETYDWPGNVRELENLVTNLCASSPENTIPEAAVSRALASPATASGAWESVGGTRTGGQPGSDARVTLPEDGIDLRAHLTNLERALYVEALRRTDGNAERAARLLGIPGHTFRKAWRERLGGG